VEALFIERSVTVTTLIIDFVSCTWVHSFFRFCNILKLLIKSVTAKFCYSDHMVKPIHFKFYFLSQTACFDVFGSYISDRFAIKTTICQSWRRSYL